MAEKESINKPKDLIEAVPEEMEKLQLPNEDRKRLSKEEREKEMSMQSLASWAPKTILGKKVKSKEITDFDHVLSLKRKILEPEIVDSLLNLEYDLLSIGQAKGKFGGGKRRAWRQTQKKTMEGNVVTFSCMAVVGDKAGHIGLGYGKAKETLPARAKAIRKAKLNIGKIKLGNESPEDKSKPHTVPFIIEGKCGSIRVKLIPAPIGTGLVIGDQGKKILRLAGIEDIYSVAKGQTRTTFNVAKAIINALEKTNLMKL